MLTEEEEHGGLVTGVLHWNYRNLTRFPAGILAKSHQCSKIKDIYLKENRIARLPRDIAALDRLESLYLSGNEIRSIPREISRLRRLQCLDLSGNRLTSLPEELGELSSLKYLVLDDNELRALPLRLADLRALRYISVCDNKLTWLPQRPVYNLQHCELRVWRNPSLCSLPYSLWYHMFRDQQIRSLNIGCWGAAAAGASAAAAQNSCVLKMHSDADERKIEIPPPAPYRLVMPSGLLDNTFPASLLELCKRVMYQMLYESARRNCRDVIESIYSTAGTDEDSSDDYAGDLNGNVDEDLNTVVMNKFIPDDNQLISNISTPGDGNNNVELPSRRECQCRVRKQKPGTTTSELIEKYLVFLPSGIKEDLKNGPPSRCENVPCKRPVFDYAYIQFCTGSLVLIDSSPACLLSAVFCSRSCARAWTALKSGVVPWRHHHELTS